MPDILKLRATEDLIDMAVSAYQVEGVELETHRLIARILLARLLREQPVTQQNAFVYPKLFWRTLKRAFTGASAADVSVWLQANRVEVLLHKNDPDTDWRAVLEEAKKNAFTSKTQDSQRIVVFALIKVLGLTSDEALRNITARTFFRHGLNHWLETRFRNSPSAAIRMAFPGRFHPWEFGVTPRGFFDSEENVIKAARWLVEEKCSYPMNDLSVGEVWDRRVARVITAQLFCRYGLAALIKLYGSPEPILRLAYPKKFLPWSFTRQGKWVGLDGRRLAGQATRWLLDEHLHISPLSPLVTISFLKQKGLGGMLASRSLGFKSHVPAVIRNAYPHLAAQLK